MDTKPKTRTVSLSDRAPVKIQDVQWPCIAKASWFDSQYEFQANREAWIRVRDNDPNNSKNPSERKYLVYGSYSSRFQGEGDVAAGYLIEGPNNLIETIRTVADELGHPKLGTECIQNLPAEEI